MSGGFLPVGEKFAANRAVAQSVIGRTRGGELGSAVAAATGRGPSP